MNSDEPGKTAAILYYSHLPRPPVHTASTLLYAGAGAPHNIKGPSLDFSLPRPNSLLSSIKSVSKSLNKSSFPSLWLLLDSTGPVWLIGSLLTALWVLFWLLTVHSPCFLASGFSYPYNQPNQIHCPQVPDPTPPPPRASLVSPNLRTLHQPFPPQECHSMAAPHLHSDPQPHYVLITRRSARSSNFICLFPMPQSDYQETLSDRQTSQTTLNIEEMRPLRLPRRLCHYSLKILPKP